MSTFAPFGISTNRRNRVPLWRILACAALALLFLYNPFLTAGRATDSLAIGHPASHRATVGSSELEQFAQPSGDVRAFLPDRADIQELIPPFTVIYLARRNYSEQQDAAVTPRTGFSWSLWFRPPPTV
jgi:hypothetical protein